MVVPDDLVGIRAYVRWEEAGKPEDTTPEWQATEFARARLDLQMEVLDGVSLNEIRRRYNQIPVDGDDEPQYPKLDPVAVTDAVKNNVVEIPAVEAVAREAAPAPAETTPSKPPPPSPERKKKKVLHVSEVRIPQDLVDIRAYVRWEEAGEPEDTPTEWQQLESAMARLDLQIEVLGGASLNDIRRRYRKDPVDGDDAPMFNGWDVSEALREAETNRANNIVVAPPPPAREAEKAPPPEVWVEPEPEPVGEYLDRGARDVRGLISVFPSGARDAPGSPTQPETFMARWAGDAGAKPASPMRLINARRYPLDRDGELLVQMYESVAEDESAVAGARTSVTKRRVVFTTDAAEELALHWGVARDEPGQWLLPEPDVWPAETTAVSEISVETPLVAGLGCLPTAAAAATQAPGAAVAEEDKECYPLQMLSLDLPGSGAEELMGVQFVLRNADGTIWFKDQTNGNSNFRANFAAPGSDTSDELLDAIIRAEAGGGWWTLMHRFNLASALLEQKCSPAAEKSPSAAALAAAKIYVWLRYSAQRKLTWQRNYNVKPRELSSAQSRLTRVVSQLYCDSPSLRDVTRLMLGTVGKGGEGGQGQQIRDEILNIMHRNGIGEQKGIWMEQWHQKLHNNTTPDDIIICEAYLAFLKSDMNLAEYWRVLGEGGITRERLESYERPIVTEPLPRPTIKMALIKDFTNYLAILKSVHSGADLVECIRACARGLGGVSPALNYVRVAQGGGGDPAQLLAACVEARHQLRDAGLASASDPEWTRELLYLDLAIDDVARRAVERSGEANYGLDDQMAFAASVLENLALSLPSSNEDVVLALIEWRRVMDAKRSGDANWALRAKAVVDRVRLAVALHADATATEMQPAATKIGEACDIESWSVDLFAEEVIRGGPAFALSLVLSRLDPALRAEADMGSWQIISPTNVAGVVLHVKELRSVMNDVFDVPTVVVADKVGGDEEFPAGAVAVLTTCSVDVLSHTAVRARNGGALFATCYDAELLDSLAAAAGSAVAVDVAGDDVAWRALDAAQFAATQKVTPGAATTTLGPPLQLASIPFCGRYTVPLEAFDEGVVGAKARNTKALNESLGGGKIPSWIRLPKSMVVPFGTMEHVLEDAVNATARARLAELERAVDDSSEEALESSLRACRACVRSMRPAPGMLDAIEAEMLRAGIDPPEDEERWEKAWSALVDVWASKWNDRAFVSLRNVGIDHADLRMSVLVQPVVDADYAFVIHTVNPSTGDEGELYAEVVAGLGEALVGNYPGRAMSFSVKKASAAEASAGSAYLAPGAEPKILGFPSKSVLLKIPRPTIIFRSDSNGEDLEGYAGAGLYESVPMDEEETVHADYAADPLVWDDAFRADLLRRVAEAGVAIEAALGGVAQDIEGVVKDGEVYVVQTRPQV